MAFTIADMRKFAVEAWGPFGDRVVDRWVELNELYFGGRLRPVPLVLTNAQPFGGRLAFCSYAPGDPAIDAPRGRTITLNVPKHNDILRADNGVLLHEMIHQFLFEAGEDPAHASAGWRREIMRLNKVITGKDIWAGRSKTARDPDDKKRVIRINEPHADGTPSLTQGEIARWPHTCDIDLGCLGNSLLAVTGQLSQ